MKKNKIFALMVAAMTFAACSTNDITSDTRYDDDNTVKIGTVTRSGEAGTTTESVTPMSDPFLLTNVTQKMNVGDLYEAMFTLTEESSNKIWSPSSKIMWYGSGVNEFQAIYPCKTKNGSVLGDIDFNKFMIPGYQYENSDSIPDWMRATANVARSNGALNLNFEHMLSKVTVEIDYNNISLDDKAVTSASVSKIFTRVQYCEAVTGADGKVTIEAYQKVPRYETDGLYVWTTPKSDADNKKASTTAIVAPGAYSNIAKVSVSYEGGSEEIVLYLPADYTLEAGKHYTFTLSSATITHKEATISSVSVEPWDEGTISSSKPAEFIPYVTFTSNEEVGFKMEAVKGEESDFTISGLEYSVNNGEWKSISENGISEGVTFGGSNGSNLRLRGKNKNGTSTSIWSYANISFTPFNENSDTQVACTGDIRTLLDYENYNTVETSNARFCRLFENCTQLTSAPELPATTLASACYSNMFEGCKSLTTAPELKATTLANSCYSTMFRGCTSLTTAPKLPATTLANSCYDGMFDGCTALTSAPELPASTLANNCYSGMFNGCTSLTTAPELKATTLANSCYSTMFCGCTSLTTAPKLPATTLANNCYSVMFNGCTSLTTAPELKATTLANSCYSTMFRGCTSLTTAPELKATTLAENCYYRMFQGCTKLTTAPALKAETLAESCYQSMFQGCTKLTTAPALKAETLAESCYQSMFQGCTQLTTAPALPAKTLADYCYSNMFEGCALETAPALQATTLASDCYSGMFKDCTSLTQAPALPATILKKSCYSYMFKGCSNLKSVTMLATYVTASDCLKDWLYNAGNSNQISSRTLKVNSQTEYDAIKSNLPTEWKAGPSGATILDKDGNDITSTITSSSSN